MRLRYDELSILAHRALIRIGSGGLGSDAAFAYHKIGDPAAMVIALRVIRAYFGGFSAPVGAADFSIACHSVAMKVVKAAKAA